MKVPIWVFRDFTPNIGALDLGSRSNASKYGSFITKLLLVRIDSLSNSILVSAIRIPF